MIAGPVAVIPLACGRVELGLWPCGRLDTMVAGPVAVDMLPTTYDLLPTTDYRLPTTGKALLGRRLFWKGSTCHSSGLFQTILE